MRLDHLSFAAGPEGMAKTAEQLSGLLGAPFDEGGIHPRYGTQNMILPVRGGIYVEVVEALEHPASDKAPFGQAVKARSSLGGGWLGWVVKTGDMDKIEKRLGRPWVDGNRKLPDGSELLWKQIGVNGLIADPQLPFFIHWISPFELHPSNAPTDISLKCIEISGDPQRVRDYLGEELEERVDYYTGKPADEVEIEWVAEHGTPGLVAAVFDTPNGEVRI
jgi:hypothetical protein